MEAIQNHNITISGLIGAGKTTLAHNLSELLSWTIIGESVEDNPYLDLFYEDMEKYGFAMQIYFLNHRFEQEQIEFFDRVRKTYIDRSKKFPKQYKVVDASKSLDQVELKIEVILEEFLKKKL